MTDQPKERDIKVGYIVTVRLDPDKYGDNKFQGKQGTVVAITEDGHKDGPIGVKFPGWYQVVDKDFFDRHMRLGANGFGPDSVIRFECHELTIDEAWRQPDISQKIICDLLFGHSMWHTVYTLSAPFVPGYATCEHEGCERKATLRILVNCHGVVSEYDVCPEHGVYHGRNCDGFPTK